MPSPFPGMDPYLEDPEIWPDFHASLAIEIKGRLNRQIGPAYYATVEIQSVANNTEVDISQSIRPDVSIYETPMTPTLILANPTVVTLPAAPIMRTAPLPIRLRAVRIYRTLTKELVTTIEILSPFNKQTGSDGIIDYRRKRALILASHVHLVEVDLLRRGERPGLELNEDPLDTDYILLVNRYDLQRVSEIWPVALNEALPLIPVPLTPPDPDIALDLNAAIGEVYAASGYDWRISYQPPIPRPPVRPALRGWVETLLASRAKPQTIDD